MDALRRAAAEVPNSPPVRLNLANALVAAGKADEAEAAFKAMAKDFPDDWRPLRELHVLLRSQAREEEALEAIEEASRRNPDDLDLILAVASQRLLLLDNPGAAAAYQRGRRPRSARTPAAISVWRSSHELSNRTEDLARLVGEAEARGADPDIVNFIRAFDHRRAKRFRGRPRGDWPLSRPSIETARQAQLLGQLNDGAGNYDEAWKAFSRMNEIQRADPSRPEERAAAYRQSLRQEFRGDHATSGRAPGSTLKSPTAVRAPCSWSASRARERRFSTPC